MVREVDGFYTESNVVGIAHPLRPLQVASVDLTVISAATGLKIFLQVVADLEDFVGALKKMGLKVPVETDFVGDINPIKII